MCFMGDIIGGVFEIHWKLLANVDECTIKHHVKFYLLTSILVAMI